MDLFKSKNWLGRWDDLDKDILSSQPSTKKVLQKIAELINNPLYEKILEFGKGELEDFLENIVNPAEHNSQSLPFIENLKIRVTDPVWSLYKLLTEDFTDIILRFEENKYHVSHGVEFLGKLDGASDLHLRNYGLLCVQIYNQWNNIINTTIDYFPDFGEYVLQFLPRTLSQSKCELQDQINRDRHLSAILFYNKNTSIGDDISNILEIELLKIEEAYQRRDAYKEALINADIDPDGDRPYVNGIACNIFDSIDDVNYELNELSPEKETLSILNKRYDNYLYERLKRITGTHST